jgi:hypothetical protein
MEGGDAVRKIVGFSAGDGFAQLLLSGGGRVRLRVGDEWPCNADGIALAEARVSFKRELGLRLAAGRDAEAQEKRADEAEESLRAALRAKESACDARDHVQALYEEERAARVAADERAVG